MQKMGAHVGSVLGRVDAFHQLERQREINEAVLAVVRAVSRGDDIQSLLHCIVTAAYKIANPERVSLYLVDNFRQELWLAISRDISGKTFPMDVGIASSVAREGKTVLIEDAYSDPRFNSDIDKETGFETKQVLCLPISLVSKTGSPIAVLQLLNKTDAPSFTHEDQEAMEAFCYEAAVALKRMSMDAVFLKLFEEENKSSGVHSLTRMPSNTGFEGVGDFQPYRVRELAPRMAGSRRLSVTSASNRRFQCHCWKAFRMIQRLINFIPSLPQGACASLPGKASGTLKTRRRKNRSWRFRRIPIFKIGTVGSKTDRVTTGFKTVT
eukprot:gb/GECG01006071.1/.p1 GENE.gb/GECG01006071.1/~~gb/GECG01006071.1/.p1  ORF type:complete len:324 (+),score=25.93 gb/GECG01006071.1/:1-972(+)